MKIIKQTYLINAPVKEVWSALVDAKVIETWGAGPAKMDDKAGTNFSLWGGDIYGKNIKVEKNKLLAQEWFGGKWTKPSIVTFTLKPEGSQTRLDLHHTGIPNNEMVDINEGWKKYYLEPLKKLLEKSGMK